MAVPKHPIAHDWIKQTLVPFLFHAFTATLPHPADISEQIERSIDFCHRKPDHPSDGDDLVFERIFMAIMHRHKDLEPELEMVVDNLEPLAKYLIRRAQLKGPYDLLGRTDIASGAWVEHERQRLADLVLEPEEAKEEICPLMRLPPTPAKLPPTEHDIDPRLVHAQQGQFAAEGLVGQLTADEDAYYRHQNQELENYCLRQQQQLLQHQPAAPDRFGIPTYHLPGGGSSHAFNVHGSPYQPPQQLPMQQTLQSPVHTRRGTPQQEKLWPTMTSAPQSVPQTQNVQPRPTAYGFFSSSVSTQPSTDYLQCPLPQLQPAQHPTTQFWAAQHQPSHHTAAQYPSAQPLQSIQNYVRAAIPAPSPQVSSPQSVLTPSRPALASGQVSNTFPSSDSAHLRGSDWSDAAQQRAREIASKITAHERDTIAQGIIERQQAMVQQSSALTPTASMYSPTKTISHMPTRSHSATEYTSTPATASGMQTPAMPAKNSWGMAMPSSDSKPGLPTLEQVRSRYRPQQQQQRRRPGTASSAMPQLCDYLHGATEAPAMPLTSTALATPSKQWQSSMPTSKDVQWSLPQPLEQVVSRTDINAFAPTSHGGLPTPSPSTGDSGFSGQEHEHVYMENM